MNSNNQSQASVNINAITTAFEQSQEMYNRLVLLTQDDFPDDIMREAYEEFIDSLANARRITSGQYSLHLRNRLRLASEARRERLRQQQPAPEPAPLVTVIGETPIISLTPPGPPPPLILPVATMMEPSYQSHTPPGPPPPFMISGATMMEPSYQSHTPPGPPPPFMISGARQRPRARRSTATSSARIIRVPKHTVRTLKRSELESTVTDPCSICMESYTRSNSVETSCAHTFCKDCFSKHEQSMLNRANIVCCPLCRHSNPIVTEFCARKTPIKRNIATMTNPTQV